ncbi:MAG TPA: glucose-1-phosphate adenylyltransferase [Bacteroidota bacterium]|nr:glucose-1-phosphate adenylyltransferase [Bacteroidota bacterium]
MPNVVALILGGGRGERLFPLTKLRAKPAIPIAGKYRLIDIPVSNCINSQVLKIYVLTQFNSASLNQHVANTYRFSPFMKGFVDVLAAQQTLTSPEWFQGTADAVRKVLWVVEPATIDYFLILSGDHLYRMDYRPFIEHHIGSGADVTISVQPIGARNASDLGLMKIDPKGMVREFNEKPKGEALRAMEVDTTAVGVEKNEAARKKYLASMGIYVFSRKAMVDLLTRHPADDDFGKNLIPRAIQELKVSAYAFGGYWEDIGTIESFYGANMGLLRQPKPAFSFYDMNFPIYTRTRFLPPSKVLDGRIKDAMICEGSIIKGAEVTNSIVGIRSRVEQGAVISDSLLMGADGIEPEAERIAALKAGIPAIGIGENSVIRNAIIDKNVRIGRNVSIVNKDNIDHAENEKGGYWIRNGIVVALKGAIIPDGTSI